MTAPDPLDPGRHHGAGASAAAERDSTIAILSAKANGAGAVTFDRQACKGVGSYPKTEAFNSGRRRSAAARSSSSRYTKGDRIILERNEAFWGEKPAWQRVVFRPITSAGPRVAALLAGDVDLIENVPIQDLARVKPNAAFKVVRGPLQPRHLPAFQLSRRAGAGRRRHRRQEPVPRQARARGDLQGDRPRRHRRAHHGRRGGARPASCCRRCCSAPTRT